MSDIESSCVRWRKQTALVMLRAEAFVACEFDHCAACLLNYFVFWHGWKLKDLEKRRKANDVAQLHGDGRTQDETLFQFHSISELRVGLVELYSENAIRSSIQRLIGLGFISVQKNPNPRYYFDKTQYFLLDLEKVQSAIDGTDMSKLSHRSQQIVSRRRKNQAQCIENQAQCIENQAAITEITSETSSKITSKKVPPNPLKGEHDAEPSLLVSKESHVAMTQRDASRTLPQPTPQDIAPAPPTRTRPKRKAVDSDARPTKMEDAKSYGIEIGLPALEVEKWWDYFESNGWKIGGRAPMKSWKAAMRNWHRNWQSRGSATTSRNGNGQGPSAYVLIKQIEIVKSQIRSHECDDEVCYQDASPEKRSEYKALVKHKKELETKLATHGQETA